VSDTDGSNESDNNGEAFNGSEQQPASDDLSQSAQAEPASSDPTLAMMNRAANAVYTSKVETLSQTAQ
jgi:hypothetical protein